MGLQYPVALESERLIFLFRLLSVDWLLEKVNYCLYFKSWVLLKNIVKSYSSMFIAYTVYVLLFIKGGETIRQINQASGAHVELNRNIPENGPTRLFTIRGTDQQIQQAQSMIREKTGEGVSDKAVCTLCLYTV